MLMYCVNKSSVLNSMNSGQQLFSYTSFSSKLIKGLNKLGRLSLARLSNALTLAYWAHLVSYEENEMF
jgi:hypothetical protein